MFGGNGDRGGNQGRNSNHKPGDKRGEKRSKPKGEQRNKVGIRILPYRSPADPQFGGLESEVSLEQRCEGNSGKCDNNKGKISDFCDGCRCGIEGCTREKDGRLYCRQDNVAKARALKRADSEMPVAVKTPTRAEDQY